jgi:hypothetical protein
MALAIVTQFANAETLTIECVYPTYSDERGSHTVNDRFKLTFIIDSEKGSAYVVGGQGGAKVDQVAGEDGLSFIEITGSGNVMVTTVDKKGSSVHSRNLTLHGILLPSQYYGTCVFK